MAKGRSRVEFEAGRLDIHSISAYAIDEVRIEAGDDKAVRVEIEMSNSAGIFQVDEGLGQEAARHAAGRAHRGHRPDRGRAREAPRAGLPPVMRALVWRGVEEWLAEHAQVDLHDDGVLATGVQLGAEPEPYLVEYRLDVPSGWITRRLEVEASGAGWRRSLTLEHDGAGRWTADGERLADVDGALDCDLAFSPLTNLMPVRRSALHERTGSEDFVMAWVSVPDLRLHASPQRYEHVRPGVVRFVALDGDFTAELELDADGLVVRYPRLAERVPVGRRRLRCGAAHRAPRRRVRHAARAGTPRRRPSRPRGSRRPGRPRSRPPSRPARPPTADGPARRAGGRAARAASSRRRA